MTGRRLVPGDPASVAALATSARATARDLERVLPPLLEAALPTEAPRRAARDLARRRDLLGEATTTGREELAHVGDILQDHAGQLADDLHALRSLLERGTRAGLVLEGTRWRPDWGITGTVDPGAESRVEEPRAALQREPEVILHRAARRRAELGQALRGSTTRLAGAAADLRHG